MLQEGTESEKEERKRQEQPMRTLGKTAPCLLSTGCESKGEIRNTKTRTNMLVNSFLVSCPQSGSLHL